MARPKTLSKGRIQDNARAALLARMNDNERLQALFPTSTRAVVQSIDTEAGVANVTIKVRAKKNEITPQLPRSVRRTLKESFVSGDCDVSVDGNTIVAQNCLVTLRKLDNHESRL